MLDASEMITFTEKLIEEIKHYPILYDRRVMRGKENVEKEEAWISLTDRLPADLKLTVDDTKKRWRTLKDCYSKYLRSGKTNNRFEKRYRSWRWSGHMDFFNSYMLHNDSVDGEQSTISKKPKTAYGQRTRDYQTHIVNERFRNRINEDVKVELFSKRPNGYKKQLQSTRAKGEIDEEVLDEVDDESYQAIANAVSEYANASPTDWDQLVNDSDTGGNIPNTPSRSIASIEQENFIDPLMGRSFDSIDLTFLGYASSIKKLPPRKQSLLKFAVAKMIMQEELAQQNEDEKSLLLKGDIKNDIEIERM
ncbi:uncharacterized protein LOC128863685 [Anastrepha ludens]|uniref:uncharacterized protein LOC128863685 n=1 Tax=Anastrepha ludens TaxID=28586 RepID=UPI0023AED385|nr:uncharacterized protein LOC128863685 [Anastrepha ludens]